jgi:hypothetical protein
MLDSKFPSYIDSRSPIVSDQDQVSVSILERGTQHYWIDHQSANLPGCSCRLPSLAPDTSESIRSGPAERWSGLPG